MESDEIRNLEKKVDKILGYLYNDDGTGEKGLIADFKAHKQEMKDFLTAYNTEQAVKKAKAGLLGMIGGAILVFLKWVIVKIMEGAHNV